MEIKKTNAVRILDRLSINYQLHTYEVDENDLSATHVAESVGQNVDQVFKTLVLRGDKTGLLVAIIPGAMELNLKEVAKVSGNKNAEMIAMKELLPLTGYIRGGCSPLGMKKNFPTYIDETCILFDTIFVSAGVRGMQIEIAPADLIGATGAISSNLCF
jgi:Cys-tRNA(Pro)/Cys-tRNA(Cys) deacylase